jgi:hypothetical protein
MKHTHPHTQALREAGFGDIADHFEAKGSTPPPVPQMPTEWETNQAKSELKNRLYNAYRFLCCDEHFPKGSTLKQSIRRKWELFGKF